MWAGGVYVCVCVCVLGGGGLCDGVLPTLDETETATQLLLSSESDIELARS